MSFTIRLSGSSGEGVVSAGDILVKTLSRSGVWLNSYKTYPPALRSGYVSYQVHVGDSAVSTQTEKVDLLVAFDDKAYEENCHLITDGGLILRNGKAEADRENPGKSDSIGGVCTIPFGGLAETNQLGRSKNMIILGAIASVCGLNTALLESVIKEKFQSKGDLVLGGNLTAVGIGRDNLPDRFAGLFSVKPSTGPGTGSTRRKVLLSGNEAVAIGSIVAGLELYAGYPITPATDIMEYLARELPQYNGILFQTEDEIAALGAVIGGAFAGKRAMTATSGPGLSLMAEMLGLASMVELPVVIVDVQRGGPSTGLPTRVEQGDLNLALYGTHGEAPVVVLAPTTIEDCFYQIVNAYAVAEKFQVPVILLTDQVLAQSKETIYQPDFKNLAGYLQKNGERHEWTDYKRYRITESGISPRSTPGEKGGCYVAQGLEHSEIGAPSIDPENRTRMMKKRFRKLEGVETFLESFRHVQAEHAGATPDWDLIDQFGDPEPNLAIVGWGSTESVVREAVIMANNSGIKVGAIYPKLLNPLPEKGIGEFLDSVDMIIVPELNMTGQFAKIIESRFLKRVIRLGRNNGVPFSTDDIMKAIREVCSNVKTNSVRV